MFHLWHPEENRDNAEKIQNTDAHTIDNFKYHNGIVNSKGTSVIYVITAAVIKFTT